ncbi:PepSY domain-containing protein [Bowmanella sp. Y26]|uniref:PepSY domain-containing protein n=1 Tax=Bowmanella yangjiangensis TaxID=2811230 RepID=UPI001BDC9A36|nr:PepSY domain-containing protein [Bowmanella yangjiangensis]MBT1063311.1 PepSY domain-containing protein [Bowmanella yangjiangensis]
MLTVTAILLIVALASLLGWLFYLRSRPQGAVSIMAKARKYHKWLMGIIGIQFLIWSISGAYMVLVDIDFIHGDHLAKQTDAKLNMAEVQVDITHILAHYPKAENIKLSLLGSLPVWRLQVDGEKLMVDATNGAALPPLSESQAIRLAKDLYSGSSQIVSSQLLTEHAPPELSPRHLPVWRIEFAGMVSPTLYITQQQGELVTRRHDFWRVFDLMWKLHIMDYDDGEDIDNWLLRILAIVGVLAALTGLILTILRFAQPTSRKGGPHEAH